MSKHILYIGVLGALALPVAMVLARRYEPYSDRVRLAAGPRFAVSLSDEEILARVQRQVGATAGTTARLVWKPDSEPRTGVVSVHDLTLGGEPQWRVVTVRHDVACTVCRDVYAAAVYHLADDALSEVVLLDDWEVKGDRVETAPFLAQFAGIPRGRILTPGVNVDGLSGATKSVDGLIRRLNDADAWRSDLAAR